MIEVTFDQQPWYGSSIMEVLSTIPADVATLKGNQTHSIIELVLHMTMWRKFATERLLGNGGFEVSEDENFRTSDDWAGALEELKASQEKLLRAARQFAGDRLTEIVPSKRMQYTYHTLLHGIIQHDLYHLGQIALLKKQNMG